jgi:hypothetical protein
MSSIQLADIVFERYSCIKEIAANCGFKKAQISAKMYLHVGNVSSKTFALVNETWIAKTEL